MGYDMGSTRVEDRPGQPAISESVRHAVTGRAMDMNAVSSLLAICLALQRHNLSTESSSGGMHASTGDFVPMCSAAAVSLGPLPDYDEYCWHVDIPTVEVNAHFSQALHCMAVTEEEVLSKAAAKRDIWCDSLLLQFVQTGHLGVELSPVALRRLQQRSRAYQYRIIDGNGVLHRSMADGSVRVVPPPEARAEVIKVMHERCGHFGEKRTVHLVLTHFWWYGLYQDVCQHVKACELCRRVNLTFSAQSPELQPLPIMGYMYRWGVDLAGPFLPSERNNRFIMICIEHFTKHIELIALPEKAAKHTAHAFLSHVLSRFGACAEVITDQGTEWKADFDALLESCYIDHRVTSPNCPSSDGLAERAVQTIKQALRKLCEQSGSIRQWDVDMHWVALGYRCSPQASTRLSPYELLYARRPTVPPAIVQRLSHDMLCFDDPDLAAESLLARAKMVEQMCVEAGNNLKIAQHRDSLRYALIRSGEYKPSLMKFYAGQFVYVQETNVANTLQVRARPNILRVVDVRPGGSVILQGKCGTTINQNIKNLAPCHLPNIDPTIDVTLQPVPADHACEVCRFPDRASRMLLCDRLQHRLAPGLSYTPVAKGASWCMVVSLLCCGWC